MEYVVLQDADGDEVSFEEGSSGNIVATFKDNDGVAISEAALATLTLTLYVKPGGAVINSRNAQNVKDANGGTVATDGTLTMRLQPLDNVIVGNGEVEQHVARFTWTWVDSATVTRTGIKEIVFSVVNLATVTA